MKLLLLSDHLSVHASKWALSLASAEREVLIFSLTKGTNPEYAGNQYIQVVSREIDLKEIRSENIFHKAKYVFALAQLKKTIRLFKPDIVHAHYATSYGLLGTLSGFHPLIISVWGSDVYEFPSNFLKRMLLKYNLRKADRILSTSYAMADEIKKYSSKKIDITPFGVDTNQFKLISTKSVFPEGSFVIGTIKTLEDKYGISYLILAFKLLKDKFNSMPLKLLIVGSGSQEIILKKLVKSLELQNDTIFIGHVTHAEVPSYLNMLDIYVALSIQESFGVAVLEASSCELPVVVSAVGGLPEVVKAGITGTIVPHENEYAAFEALSRLLEDNDLRHKMGKAGREWVVRQYEWKVCIQVMTAIYDAVGKEEKNKK